MDLNPNSRYSHGANGSAERAMQPTRASSQENSQFWTSRADEHQRI
jgi:hypothetical protein